MWFSDFLLDVLGLASDKANIQLKRSGGINPMIRAALLVFGGVATLLAVGGLKFVYVMFSHPGGMGAERLFGPIVLVLALLFLFIGIGMLFIAFRAHPTPPSDTQ